MKPIRFSRLCRRRCSSRRCALWPGSTKWSACRKQSWFGKLALAFKKTALESIDLEIDIPRRFWMRNEAERLRSNGDLYEVLRELSDEQRRNWLSEILPRLGSLNDRERDDKMLT